MQPALGVCYYPEQWPERLWVSDARGMAAAGITYVRIGEFAWSRLEPEPGKFDFQWMLQAMHILHAEGLKVVVGTPTATPPRWLVAKMPDMLQVDAEGRTRKFGSRRHYCFSHEGYRQECGRIARSLAEAVKGHPALAAWQVDNEYGCHDTTLSYSAAALAAFRDWLRTRYGLITALNAAWGNSFWSMDYRDFDEVEFPNLTPAEANPSHSMDFRRFSSEQVVSFNKLQADILRQITPGIPISTNFMTAMTGFDHFRVGHDLDFATWDSYPVGQVSERGGSDERKTAYARQGDPDLQAFHHDLYRSVGKGRFWVMEQQPGPVNWASHNADPLTGIVRLWTWEAFAHGAEAVSYFRWRQAPFAQEQMHSGLMRPDDQAAPGLTEARQVADEVARFEGEITSGPAECAIVFDYEGAWAWQIQPQSAGFDHFRIALAQYRQLRKLGLDVDIISPETHDLAPYKLVFVPSLFAWTDALREAMTKTEALIVIGPRSGSKTKDFRIPDRLPPDLPPEILDVKVVRVDSIPDSIPVPIKGGGNLVNWREKIESKAATLIESHDGWPVLVRNLRYFYLAGLADDDAHRFITRRIAQLAGLKTLMLPDGIRTRRAGETTFVFNYSLQSHSLESIGFKRPFGLDGGEIGPAGVSTARSLAR